MEALSETLRPTQNLGICWLGATALLHRTFHLLLLRRHCKITFLIGTRYDGFIWLLLTHGVRGSTTLLKSEQWLTWWNILQTPLTCAVWFHWCRKAVGFLPDAAGLSTGMPLITQNFLVICSGPVGCKGSIGLLIPWHKAPLSCSLLWSLFNWRKGKSEAGCTCPVRIEGSRANEWSETHSCCSASYAMGPTQRTTGLEALKSFESVPRRWPLARLTVPLLKCVEYLDRVLAGCCWEVLITRKDPDDSLGALRQAAKSLTLTLASYLADFVAETLRASRTPQGGPLTDEENIHLLGANFWVQPIYQELLHAASGHNVSVDGERKRPCSGLVKIVAKPRRAKTRVPAVDTACVSDWIGGHCPADSLMIWFPAHWAPQVIRELESREQRAWLSPAVPAMVWWAVPRQVREAIPRCTWQSHSTFPQPPISKELCQAAQCFYSGWLVLSAYGEVFGPDAAVTARIGQGGLCDQSILTMGWQ